MGRRDQTSAESGGLERHDSAAGRRLFSASHDEILQGLTTDAYFVNTSRVLERTGLADARVTAEIFLRSEGVLAGVDEALRLLAHAPGAADAIEAWSLPEGSPIEAKQVVMRIRGPYKAFALYETALLGILAHSSGWATAASRVVRAAVPKPVYSFGARHIHPAVAPVMERAALVGGAAGAACVLGARLMGQEPVGTMSHAYLLITGDTVVGAQAYDQHAPDGSPRIVLVDTFKDEAEEALRVAAALGPRLEGIRLDTPAERGGVTPGLLREVRARLDLAGRRDVRILVSGGLTAERIEELKPFADAFGVGSAISTAPPIEATMDVKEVDGRPVAKRGRIPGLTDAPGLERRDLKAF